MTLAAGAIVLAADVAKSGFTSEGWSAAVAAGAGTFLAWALGRELDPDVPITALVGALLSIGTTLWLGSPSLLLMTGMLLGGRVLLRPTGHPPRLLDLLGLLAIGAFLGTGPEGGAWHWCWPSPSTATGCSPARRLGCRAHRGRPHCGRSHRVGDRAGIGVWMSPTIGAWTVAGIGFVAGATTTPRPILPL